MLDKPFTLDNILVSDREVTPETPLHHIQWTTRAINVMRNEGYRPDDPVKLLYRYGGMKFWALQKNCGKTTAKEISRFFTLCASAISATDDYNPMKDAVIPIITCPRMIVMADRKGHPCKPDNADTYEVWEWSGEAWFHRRSCPTLGAAQNYAEVVPMKHYWRNW